MNILVVVDKNGTDGNYCKSSDAKIFINEEPIARTLTCKCGGGQEVHHNNMVVVMNKKKECEMLGMLGDEGFEKVRRVYSTEAACLAISTKEDRIKIMAKIERVGQISSEGSQCGTVVSSRGQSPTISAGCHGYANPHICEEKLIVAMRGRNPENPTDRTTGIHTEQRLEKAPQGVVNTLTTVQKDNLVLEKKNIIYDDYNSNIPDDQECIGTITPTCGSPTMRNGKKIIEESQSIEIKQATKEGSIKCKVGGCYDASFPDSKTRRGRVQEGGDVTPTLTASNSENIHYVETQYRIRKLTPKECWRLMGFTDQDFEKAKAAGVSNSQLYKQAGNAIVKQVLMAIFKEML